jgi:hypothetical protein
MFCADAKNSDKSVTHGDTDFEDHEEPVSEPAEERNAMETEEAVAVPPPEEEEREAVVAETQAVSRPRGRPRK